MKFLPVLTLHQEQMASDCLARAKDGEHTHQKPTLFPCLSPTDIRPSVFFLPGKKLSLAVGHYAVALPLPWVPSIQLFPCAGMFL